MEMNLIPCGCRLVSCGKDKFKATENEIDELNFKIKFLEE